MNKTIKATASIFAAILFAILYVCCNNFCSKTIVNDVSKYLQVNNYVNEELASSFLGILPSSDTIDDNTAKYYYSYDCALLGSPNFIIYLCNTVDDVTFSKEKDRVGFISENTSILDENRMVYYIGDLETAIKQYTDDEIYDGAWINLELAILDEKTKMIEYLVASQQDNNKREAIVSEIIENLAHNKT